VKDVLTLTLRLHDPDEKRDATKSTSWVVLNLPRADLAMKQDDFLAKYITPNLAQLKQLQLS